MKWNDRKNDPKYQLLLKQNQAAFMATHAIEEALERKNINQSGLATTLGKSRSWISKLLAGGQNLTIFTLVAVADALGMDVQVRLVDRPAKDTEEPVRAEPLNEALADAYVERNFALDDYMSGVTATEEPMAEVLQFKTSVPNNGGEWDGPRAAHG